MHHGTCVTHVPWCMSGLLTSGGGENAPGIPGACAIRNLTYLIRGPLVCIRCRCNCVRILRFVFTGDGDMGKAILMAKEAENLVHYTFALQDEYTPLLKLNQHWRSPALYAVLYGFNNTESTNYNFTMCIYTVFLLDIVQPICNQFANS